MRLKRRALFLDRDGVINIDTGHAHLIEQIQFVPGIFDLVKFAVRLGYLVVVVTNQAGIAKGFYSEAQFQELTDWMKEQFSINGSEIADVLFCPHHENAVVDRYKVVCACRKPNPGMLLEAVRRHDIDTAASVLVGDHWSDLIAAQRAGVGKLYLLGNADDGLPPDDDLIKKTRKITFLWQVELEENPCSD
jgi:D-glycero-D-manno-heptose 1,7-bisphosphate phosphatase